MSYHAEFGRSSTLLTSGGLYIGLVYRQDAVSRYINLLTGGKSAFSPRRGDPRLVVPIHVKFGLAKGHVGTLSPANFHANQCPGWERGPQNGKIHFQARRFGVERNSYGNVAGRVAG